jgi:hypothetical protein
LCGGHDFWPNLDGQNHGQTLMVKLWSKFDGQIMVKL